MNPHIQENAIVLPLTDFYDKFVEIASVSYSSHSLYNITVFNFLLWVTKTELDIFSNFKKNL